MTPESSDVAERFALVALIALGVAALAPVLVVAGPVALLVDRRGWRRWPATVAGVALSAAIAAAGGASAYGRVLARLARGVGPAGPDLLLAVALGVALGT